jgi:hypothetical protein
MAAEPAPHDALVCQFIAAVLQRTLDCPTPEAHQQALQAFLDDLMPWLSPGDVPRLLGPPFTLLAHVAFTPTTYGDDEDVAVVLSPQGAAVFRAWLRQRGLDPWRSRS